MNPRRNLLLLLVVVMSASLLFAAGTAGADPPPGAQGQDYDLSTLQLKDATYNASNGTITTTGAKAKVLLPAMPAAPAGGRYLEVSAVAGPSATEIIATWYEAGGVFKRSTPVIINPGSGEQVALFDLNGMGATDGVVRVRVIGDPGTVVHRITLIEPDSGGGGGKPNIVFIVVDDMRFDDMELGFNRKIPGEVSNLETLLLGQGTLFENFFNSTPLCCPARASYLTGQYAHNHGVYGNNGLQSDPLGFGGILKFYNDARDVTSLGTWMQGAGYDTVLIGKYLNGYPNKQGLKAQGVQETYIPTGWDDWYGTFNHDSPFSYYDFRINENGSIVQYNDDYLTDIESDHAVDYIAGQSGPFFMYLSPYAPHGPTEPRLDHIGVHEANNVTPGQPPPSCNEADLSDKPSYIRDNPNLNEFGSCWGPGWQEKLDMTLALDELIGDVIGALDAKGVLDNTYIFFTSDNGLLRGEHKIGGKSAPYENSINVPLVVRGPGVTPAAVRDHLVLGIDLAPTFLDIGGFAGTPAGPAIDGESIEPLLDGGVPEASWRDGVLIELRTPTDNDNQPHIVPRYYGLRTQDYSYVEYETGEIEIYDLNADPHQVQSIHATAPQSLKNELASRLAGLKTCVGSACAAAARFGNQPPIAAFTSSCTALQCSFNGTGSSDPDGVIVSYAWDFGDGGTATGASPSHTYAAAGTYSVKLTVTDDDGAQGTLTKSVAVSDGTASLHLHDIKWVIKTTKDRAIAKVFVRDQAETRVENATVTGAWTVNGAGAGNGSGVTNDKGRAKIALNLTNPTSGTQIQFCVTDISHATLPYATGSNHVPTCATVTWP